MAGRIPPLSLAPSSPRRRAGCKKTTMAVVTCLTLVIVDMFTHLSDSVLCSYIATPQTIVYDEHEDTRYKGGCAVARRKSHCLFGGAGKGEQCLRGASGEERTNTSSSRSSSHEARAEAKKQDAQEKSAAESHEITIEKEQEDSAHESAKTKNVVSKAAPEVPQSKSSSDVLPEPHHSSMDHLKPSDSSTYDRYCEWDQNPEKELSECWNTLLSKNSTPFTDTSWYFLGDSTMRRLFESMISMHEKYRTIVELDDTGLSLFGEPELKNVKTAGKGAQMDTENKTLRVGVNDHQCGSLSYLGFKPGTWVPPNTSRGEGPLEHGLQQPFCHDVRTSYSKQMRRWRADAAANASAARPTAPQLSPSLSHILEFILVDYARDVELPTETTNTTQETVARYLERQKGGNSTVCVVNNGLHDVAIPGNTRDVYVANVREYLNLLQPHCSQMIWIASTATLEWTQRPHRNDQIQDWNEGVLDMIRSQLPNVFFIDVWDISLRAPHADNIYLKPKSYYDRLAILFYKLMR